MACHCMYLVISLAPAQIATPYRQHLEGAFPFNAADRGLE